jgi:hypothetical protein
MTSLSDLAHHSTTNSFVLPPAFPNSVPISQPSSSHSVPPPLPIHKSNGVTINDHSWFDKMAHLDLDDGRTVRVEMKALIIKENMVAIRVRYNDKHAIIRAHVSPIFIMHCHHVHWAGGSVSETEEGEFREKEIVEVLPLLRLPETINEKLTQQQKEAFSWEVRQVDRIQKKI